MMMLQQPPAAESFPGWVTTAARQYELPVRQARQFTLAAQPAAVPAGRHAVQETLGSWGLDAVADTVVLLASELLTNAVKAASAAPAPGGDQLALIVRRTGPGVLVEVWDPSPVQATQRDPGLTDECGRGLLLVETLSSAWGQRPAGTGKTIWCEIPLPG